MIERGSLERLVTDAPGAAGPVAARRARAARRAAARGCRPRSRSSRRSTTAGVWLRDPARVGAGAVASAAQRVPPLHRRSAPARDGRERGRARRRASIVPICSSLAALLHDLGKRDSGDHVEVGVELARRLGLATRVSRAPTSTCSPSSSRTTCCSPRSRSAATSTIPRPSNGSRTQVSSVESLQLLAALTEADSLATGPAAWGPAKAQLVGLLVDRVTHVLRGGEPEGIEVAEFPTAEQLNRLSEPGERDRGSGRRCSRS